MKVLVDSSFLFALADPADINREKALTFTKTYPDIQQVVPDVALTEVTYLIRRFIGFHAVPPFLRAFARSDAELECLTKEDIKRAEEIMSKYADARLDFVDCCIMALSERLNITRVITFDRRDFPLFKPNHCPYLELLP